MPSSGHLPGWLEALHPDFLSPHSAEMLYRFLFCCTVLSWVFKDCFCRHDDLLPAWQLVSMVEVGPRNLFSHQRWSSCWLKQSLKPHLCCPSDCWRSFWAPCSFVHCRNSIFLGGGSQVVNLVSDLFSDCRTLSFFTVFPCHPSWACPPHGPPPPPPSRVRS